MKTRVSIVLSFCIVLLASCCGIDDANRFHAPINISFQIEEGVPQIGPLGDFEIGASKLYNEENELINSEFIILEIDDWNKEWFDDNVVYERNYSLVLERKSTNKEESFEIDIIYEGEVNRCDAYEINEIQISINDSIHYQDFFRSRFFLGLE